MIEENNFKTFANMASWKSTRRQLVILIPVYASAVMTGCMEGWQPNAVYFFTEDKTEISATLTECAIMSSITELGRILFAFPSGFLVDRYGRMKILAGLNALNILPWVILASSESMMAVYIARFIVGMNYALSNASSVITIGEIASPDARGKLVVLRNICVDIGTVFQSIISIAFSSYRILIYSSCLLSVLSCLSSLWLIETPHHLIRESKYEKARRNLMYCLPGYLNCDIDREFEKIKEYIEAEKKRKSEINWLQFVRTKSIRNPLATAMLLVFFQTLIGTQVMTAYITLIIPNDTPISKKFYPLIMAMVVFPSRFFTVFCIDKFARRKLCMAAGFTVFIIHMSNAFSYYFYNTLNWQMFFWIFASGNVLVKALVSSTVSPLSNIMKSEIFPQTVKGLGGSLCLLSNSSGNFIGYQLFETVKHLGLHYMYTFNALACLMFILVVYLRLPEGKAKTLIDIQKTNYIDEIKYPEK